MLGLYAILGGHRRSTNDELKKLYYALAKSNHPDRVPDAVGTFSGIALAWSVLGNRLKRRAYDAQAALLHTVCTACRWQGSKRKTTGWATAVVTPCKTCGGEGYV